MYIILTSKPGLFHTVVGDDVDIIESYNYQFYGKTKAIFSIAELDHPTKVRIVEDEPPFIANNVPTKFLGQFGSIEEARNGLRDLTRFANLDISLVRRMDPQDGA